MSKKTTINSCPGEGCHGGCLHVTHVEDGKIVRIERLTFPDGQHDTLCIKGAAGARLPYNPDRLKHPLKRVGARGEGKWERITWEQALDEIAAKFKKISDEYGPAAIGIMPGTNSMSPMNGIQHMLIKRLMNLMQATNMLNGFGGDSNAFFAAKFSVGHPLGNHIDPATLTEGKTKYMIAWGNNPAEMAPKWWSYIRKAQSQGAKLVDIGVLHDPTAKAADWWIPVKTGSDPALALAMLEVIIREKLYAEDYVAQHTNGAFLVRKDNGRLLREREILSGGSDLNYVIWDAASGQPQAVAPRQSTPAGVRPTLLGDYIVGGIECQPVFHLLAVLAAAHPPQSVEEISGVPAATIEKLAREYAAAKPAAILINHGLRYLNSGNAYRAIDALGAITGNVGELGGGTICGLGSAPSSLVVLNEFPIVHATKAQASTRPLAHLFRCMTTGRPYPIKAMLNYYWNPVHTYSNPQRWTAKVFPNLDVFVVSDIMMTATAEYADYVLPDCTVFEKDDLTVGQGGHIVYLEKAIEPLHECRPPIYVWTELAKRLGFGEYFDKTLEEWMALRLDSPHASIAGIQPPLTLERLKNERIIRANVPAAIFNHWSAKKFATPSGRAELYNEEFVPAGDALPVFREPLESKRSALAAKYPLVFMTANNIYFLHSQFANDPQMLEKYLKEPHLYIHPGDAGKRNIADREIVVVYNDRGRFKVKALISEDVPAGVVNIPHGWWPKQFIAGHLQDLVLPLAVPETGDMAREIYWQMTLKEEEAYTPLPEGIFTYSSDVYYDCLCEVARSEPEI